MRSILLVLAALLNGSLARLISPPLGWIGLHPFVWVPGFWLIERLRPGRAFRFGWAGGFAMNLALLPWLPHTVVAFSRLPTWVGLATYLLYALAFGLFLGVFAWAWRRVRRASRSWWPFGIATWFAACEFLNPQLLPFHQASPWFETPSLFLLTSLTGMAGGTFLVILCNAVVLQAFECLTARGRRPWRPLARNAALLWGLVVLTLAWSSHRSTQIARAEREADSIRVALVQSNLYGEPRWRLRDRGAPGALGHDLVQVSRQALREHGPIDVFIWPEGALSAPPHALGHAELLAFARESGAEIWTGASFSGRRGNRGRRPFNSAFRIDAQGRIDRRYDKHVLVPFGEYVPWTDVLPVLRRIPGLGRYVPGEELGIYDALGARFVFLICYEAILPDVVRDALHAGSNLLVNVTFDGWFGDSAAPHQHLMLAAAQAAQLGVPLVRSATTGISAFVDARGVINARTGLFRRSVLVRDVKPLRVPSLYAALGDWFAWGCVGASAALLGADLWARRRRKRVG